MVGVAYEASGFLVFFFLQGLEWTCQSYRRLELGLMIRFLNTCKKETNWNICFYSPHTEYGQHRSSPKMIVGQIFFLRRTLYRTFRLVHLALKRSCFILCQILVVLFALKSCSIWLKKLLHYEFIIKFNVTSIVWKLRAKCFRYQALNVYFGQNGSHPRVSNEYLSANFAVHLLNICILSEALFLFISASASCELQLKLNKDVPKCTQESKGTITICSNATCPYSQAVFVKVRLSESLWLYMIGISLENVRYLSSFTCR